MPDSNDEKRELLKLKQGLIEDSDIIDIKPREEAEKLTGLARFENFMYHNKWYVIVAIFFIAVGSFLIYQFLSKEAADMRVLVVTSDIEKTPNLLMKTADIELALEQYCPDYDGNGNVHVEVYYIDLSKNVTDNYYISTNTAKFFGEVDQGVAQLFICDAGISYTDGMTDEEADAEFNGFFVDLAEVTGDDSLAGKTTIRVKDTPLAAAANYENSVPDILVMGIKKEVPGMISYNDRSLEKNAQAREVLTNILNNNVINQVQAEG
ncbi:MAG: hypothetical protein J1E39_08895 [Eubacterium sp.]|nr:hypothetical protein [Eubacterium sp.]